MIENEQQYQITKTQAQKFEAAVIECERVLRLRQAEIDALESQLRDLYADMIAWETRSQREPSDSKTKEHI